MIDDSRKKMALLDTHWSSRLNSVLGRLGRSRGRSSPHMTAGTNQLWNLDTYKLWKLLHLQVFMYIKGFPWCFSDVDVCSTNTVLFIHSILCIIHNYCVLLFCFWIWLSLSSNSFIFFPHHTTFQSSRIWHCGKCFFFKCMNVWKLCNIICCDTCDLAPQVSQVHFYRSTSLDFKSCL